MEYAWSVTDALIAQGLVLVILAAVAGFAAGPATRTIAAERVLYAVCAVFVVAAAVTFIVAAWSGVR